MMVSEDFGETVDVMSRTLERLVSERERLDKAIADLKTGLSSLRSVRGDQPNGAGHPGGPDTRNDLSRSRSGFSKAVRNVARKAMLDGGVAMTRLDILEAARAAGVPIPENNAEKRVSKIISSSPEFVHVGNGYWPADKEKPATAED